MIITVWIAEGHTMLAALIAFVGIVIGVKALTVKPRWTGRRSTIRIADSRWLRLVAGGPGPPVPNISCAKYLWSYYCGALYPEARSVAAYVRRVAGSLPDISGCRNVAYPGTAARHDAHWCVVANP